MAVMMNAKGTTSSSFKVGQQGTGNLTTGSLELKGGLFSQTLQANPTATANTNYILPASDGTSGNVLTTNGAGQLVWSAPTPVVIEKNTTPTIFFADGEIVYSKTNTTTSNANFIYNDISGTLSVPNIRVGLFSVLSAEYTVVNAVHNYVLPIATVDYKVAEYLVHIKQPSSGFIRSVKIMGMYDGTDVHSTLYATLENGTLNGTLTINLVENAGNIVLDVYLFGANIGDDLEVSSLVTFIKN